MYIIFSLIMIFLSSHGFAFEQTQNEGDAPAFVLRDTTDDSAYRIIADDADLNISRGTNTTSDATNFSSTQTLLEFNSSNQMIVPNLVSCNKIASDGSGLLQCTTDGDDLSNNSINDLNDVQVTTGIAAQILINDGLGQWRNITVSGDVNIDEDGVTTVNFGNSTPSAIQNAIGDTYIETEETIDDDTIHIFTAGSERIQIDENGFIQQAFTYTDSGTDNTYNGYNLTDSFISTSGFLPSWNGIFVDATMTAEGAGDRFGASTAGYFYIESDDSGGSEPDGSSGDITGLKARALNTKGDFSGGFVRGILATAGHTDSDDTVFKVLGVQSNVSNTAPTTHMRAFDVDFDSVTSATNVSGYYINSLASTDVMTNFYGFRMEDHNSSATITNSYGLYIGNTRGATSHYSIYQSAGTDDNYFEGDLVIGNTTPLGRLSVDGDTDVAQILAQGHSTQTSPLIVAENSSATDQFTVSNTGVGYFSTDLGVGATSPESALEVQDTEGNDATLTLDADDGDDNADTWFIESEAADNDLSIVNHTTEQMKITSTGNVTITGDVTASGGDVSAVGAEAGDAKLVLDADESDDAADQWNIESEAADNDLSIVNNTTEIFKLEADGSAVITGDGSVSIINEGLTGNNSVGSDTDDDLTWKGATDATLLVVDVSEDDNEFGGHVETTGTAPAVSSCGTTPSISATATDMGGKVTIGTGITTSCTVTFNSAWGVAPPCTVSGDNVAVNYIATTTTTVLTITSSLDMASDVISYICFGQE